MSLYVKDLTCISPQNTFDGSFFSKKPIVHSGVQYAAIEPSYKGVIPNGVLRRMGRSNRMSTGAAIPLLQKFKMDGLLIATTDGGMEDCHRFLDQIMKYDEGTLTPTGFVQGSPNSAAGGLALMSRNSGYNVTHSNKGLSFENCILDAMLHIDAGDAKSLLIGCVEEISKAQLQIETLAGFIKKEGGSATSLFEIETPGTVVGEGAAMFVVDGDPQNSVAQIADVAVISHPTFDDIQQKITQLLERNKMGFSDVDAVVLGMDGDSRTAHWYSDLIERIFPNSAAFTFKNMFGDNPSASGFATWFTAKILAGETAPEMAVLKQTETPIRNILIYNHFQGAQHGFILMRSSQIKPSGV